MAEQLQSLSDLARQINVALVETGHAGLRRDFNIRLWACGHDRAIALIDEYRDMMTGTVTVGGPVERASPAGPLE